LAEDEECVGSLESISLSPAVEIETTVVAERAQELIESNPV